ncbi:MAG: hypothetical protein ACXVCE_14515 [Bacteriovorax sp.]
MKMELLTPVSLRFAGMVVGRTITTSLKQNHELMPTNWRTEFSKIYATLSKKKSN